MKPTKSGLVPENFASTVNGKETALYVLENKQGMEVCVTNYGGTILSIMTPDKEGKLANVVLCYDSIEACTHAPEPYLGVAIGRYGNRIAKGKFTLDGVEYQLALNNGPNALHGGPTGFNFRVWDVVKATENCLVLSYLSVDGEEGYPGNLQVQVAFTLADHALTIRYDADTDADTVVSLTNHSYFNLNGGGTVLDHLLQVSAEKFTEYDTGCLPTGRFISVAGTPFDFRTAKPIGRDIGADDEQLRRGQGYDHNFVLTGAETAAVLKSEGSGIRMTMRTDLPGAQIYSANCLDERTGKGGAAYAPRYAVCLGTQIFPNALRCYGFPTPILRKGQHLHTETAYSFDAE